MPIQTINQLGTGGIIKDLPPVTLGTNIFTDGNNVRFDNNAVETIKGEILYPATLPMNADYGIHWRRPDQGYNIFAKDGHIIRVDSVGNYSNMLLSYDDQYTDSIWDGCKFNGGYAVVLNNGNSTPLYCLYGSSSANTTFQELPNWNYVSGITVKAKIIRSLGYSLVACNLTLEQDGITTSAPSTIRISAQAAPGYIPTV